VLLAELAPSGLRIVPEVPAPGDVA
jgi:hypothetical protein